MSRLEEEIKELRKIVEKLVKDVETLKKKLAEQEWKSPSLKEPGYVKTVLKLFEEQLGDKPDAGLVFVGGIEKREGRIRDSFFSAIPLEEVVNCQPRKIVDVMGPFSNENRILILQALLRGAKTSSELARETGLEGGQLYHHLKELILAGYVEAVGRGRYALTEKGCIAIRVVATVASILWFATPRLEENENGPPKPQS